MMDYQEKELGEFIKTINSNVSSTELAEVLDDYNIDYRFGDNGLFVKKEDYEEALDILMRMEEEGEE